MIDIVLVNWNSGDFLSKCLECLLTKENEVLIDHVYIIDNNSTDESLYKTPLTEKVVLIKNSENFGFARACNQGFKLCNATYVLLLNPDTQIFDTTLRECLQFMEDRHDIGILGCQLIGDDGHIAKSCARFPTPVQMFYDAIGLSKIAPQVFRPATRMTDWDHKESRFVDQVMGAFMFMRNSVLKKANYFDERFFVYYEELDFSERVSKMGVKSYYYTGIKIIHSGAGTTRDVKGFRLFLNLRSRLQYAKKHFKPGGYSMVWVSTLFLEPLSRIVFSVLKGNFKEVKDILKGYKLLFGSFLFASKIKQ
ncbi:MAG: glycosyltransferase family 2 protein [Ferruginibacter sp.]